MYVGSEIQIDVVLLKKLDVSLHSLGVPGTLNLIGVATEDGVVAEWH